MKLMLCVVILSAVAILSVTVKGFGSRDQYYCWSWSNFPDWKKLYKELPTTRSLKCVYHCQLEYDGLLKTDGLIDVEKMFNLLNLKLTSRKYENKKEYLSTAMYEVMGICKNHKHISEDKCETVGLLLQCTVEEAKKRGVGGTEYILDLFSHPKHRGLNTFEWS